MPDSGFEELPEDDESPPIRPRVVSGGAGGGNRPGRKGVRFERKADQGLLPFTRIVTRPQTAIDSITAAESSRAGSGLPSDAPAEPPFGKMREVNDSLEYRPNIIHDVVTDTFENTRVNWLLEGKARLVLVWTLAILSVAGAGYLVARYGRDVIAELAASIRGRAGEDGWSLPAPEVRLERARGAVRAFLDARDWPQRLPYVLDPERVESKMRDFHDVRRESAPEVRGFEIAGPVEVGDRRWYLVTFRESQGGENAVLMQETPEGGRLDWENFVSFGTLPWPAFCAEKPETPHSLRVRIRPAGDGSASEAGPGFDAYEISHRSGPPVLTAYVDAGSRESRVLASLAGSAEWTPVNVYIRFERRGEAAGKVPVITGIVRNHWLNDAELNAVAEALPGGPAAGATASRDP